MIEPNFNLLLWIIFVVYGLAGLVSIIQGAIGTKKSDSYGISDVFTGLFMLLICFLVCFF